MRCIKHVASVTLNNNNSKPVNLEFTRAFVTDHYKGLRTDKSRRSRKSDSSTQAHANVKECAGTSDKPYTVSKNVKPSVPSKCISEQKMKRSVAYALRVLQNEASTESDSSAGDNLPPRCIRNQTPIEAKPDDTIKHCTKTEICGNSKASFSSDDLSISELNQKLRDLGLPTEFGPARKSSHSKEVDTYSDDDCEENVEFSDIDMLLMASSPKNLNPGYLTDQHRCSSVPALARDTSSAKPKWPPQSRQFSLSDGLHNRYVIMLSKLCKVIRLACSFEHDKCPRISECHLRLDEEWRKPCFSISDFLFTCGRHWRHKPSGAVSSSSTEAEQNQQCPPLSFASLVEDSGCESDTASALEKYWNQRYRLFSRFDMGIRVDIDGLFSATPEAIAAHQARRLRNALVGSGVNRNSTMDLYILDVFAGTGGNSIQLALLGFKVVAVEKDLFRINMAAHNAQIYGVAGSINFIWADFFEWAPTAASRSDGRPPFAAAILSPPWGGPGYSSLSVFDMNTIRFETERMGGDGANIWSAIRWTSWLADGNLAIFLPRNTNTAQVVGVADQLQVVTSPGVGGEQAGPVSLEVEVDLLNWKAKAMTVYTGKLCYGNLCKSAD